MKMEIKQARQSTSTNNCYKLNKYLCLKNMTEVQIIVAQAGWVNCFSGSS